MNTASPRLRDIVAVSLILAGGLCGPALRAASNASGTPTLRIGDPAPALQPEQWLKGSPISGFEKGHVYVVEFWATWCGPCKAAIPHMTALAEKFAGKADVIGVDSYETSEPASARLSKVAAFVKSEGAQMDYHVAADGLDGKMAVSWMQAAGEGGIPTAFVVGKDGRIAWIGNPSDGLETALSQVLAGSLDLDAARAHHDEIYGPENAITAAWQVKDYARVVDLIDAEVAKDPAKQDGYDAYLYGALAHTDLNEYARRAHAEIARKNGGAETYQKICTFLLIDKTLSPDAYKLGLDLVNEAMRSLGRLSQFLALGAEMTWDLGDRKGAARMQAEAVKAAEADPNAAEPFLNNLREDLTKYSAEARG